MNRFVLFTVLHAILALFYWLYVGSSLYNLWFPPLGATDGTGAAWMLVGGALYFAPVALVLAGVQFWLNRGQALEGAMKVIAPTLVVVQIVVVLINWLFFLL